MESPGTGESHQIVSSFRDCLIGAILVLLTTFVWSCTGEPNGPDKIRIGVVGFAHETCTFCPNSTGIAEWEHYGPPLRGDAVLNANAYIEGFVASARQFKEVEVEGIYAPRTALGGSSGSWITREAFEKYTDGIVTGLAAENGLDGVFLALHGAMAVEGVPGPEAEIVRRIRSEIGDKPIVATFDLHGNEDGEFLSVADGAFVTKRYPHYDARLQGERAARYLVRVIRGTYVPTTATRKPGVLTPSIFQATGVSPARDIMERARRWENRQVDVFVSVFFGFAYADVKDVGATVMVMTNSQQKLADRIADDMSDYIWRNRSQFAGRTLPKTREGVLRAIELAQSGKTPVVIADHSDRTGNSTHILQELIYQSARRFCIATIADKKAITKLAANHVVGDEVEISVGGYADQFSGHPVPIKGSLEFLGPYKEFPFVAVLLFGNENRIIVTPTLHQVTTPGILAALGIALHDLDIVSLKSRVHFRRGFHETGIAGSIVEIDAPGLGPADLSQVPYENIPEIYPLSGPEWSPEKNQFNEGG